jgi:hypothetical protein
VEGSEPADPATCELRTAISVWRMETMGAFLFKTKNIDDGMQTLGQHSGTDKANVQIGKSSASIPELVPFDSLVLLCFAALRPASVPDRTF